MKRMRHPDRIFLDGSAWCAIRGDLPEPTCIVGFGDTAEEACAEFDRACGQDVIDRSDGIARAKIDAEKGQKGT